MRKPLEDRVWRDKKMKTESEEIQLCALCGSVPEASIGNIGLFQCSNRACRQAAWGIEYWQKNQKAIAAKRGNDETVP